MNHNPLNSHKYHVPNPSDPHCELVRDSHLGYRHPVPESAYDATPLQEVKPLPEWLNEYSDMVSWIHETLDQLEGRMHYMINSPKTSIANAKSKLASEPNTVEKLHSHSCDLKAINYRIRHIMENIVI